MSNKYKYLVVAGCSLSYGQSCPRKDIYPQILADELGLKLINLAVCGSGWYSVKTSITSFINNNKEILDECFFILQTSTLERRVSYNEIPIVRTDVWEKYNIKFLSKIQTASLGFIDWEKYYDIYKKPSWFGNEDNGAMIAPDHDIDTKMLYFPEHKLYPHSRNPWKYPTDDGYVVPQYIHEQFNGLMQHWAEEILSYHLFLKNLNIKHIIVDGYVPMVSYKLNFRDYYERPKDMYGLDEFEITKQFFSNNVDDLSSKVEGEDDYMVYDFKNISSGWMFDMIDSQYKIDDVVLWSLFGWKEHNSSWNIDGGHAGPDGMRLIAKIIKMNLIEKNLI